MSEAVTCPGSSSQTFPCVGLTLVQQTEVHLCLWPSASLFVSVTSGREVSADKTMWTEARKKKKKKKNRGKKLCQSESAFCAGWDRNWFPWGIHQLFKPLMKSPTAPQLLEHFNGLLNCTWRWTADACSPYSSFYFFMRVARREHNECRVGEDQYWNNMIQIKEIWYYTDLFYFKGIFMLVALTVADDSTQRISFEVKLNVHVLSLWIRAQQLQLNTDHETVQIYSVDKQHKKNPVDYIKDDWFVYVLSCETWDHLHTCPERKSWRSITHKIRNFATFLRVKCDINPSSPSVKTFRIQIGRKLKCLVYVNDDEGEVQVAEQHQFPSYSRNNWPLWRESRPPLSLPASSTGRLKQTISVVLSESWKSEQKVLCVWFFFFFPSSLWCINSRRVLSQSRPSSAGEWAPAKLNKPAALSKMKRRFDS